MPAIPERCYHFILNGRYLFSELPLMRSDYRFVWLATDLALNIPVVIKGGPYVSPFTEGDAIWQEYRRLLSLSHPQIPRAYDYGMGRFPGDEAGLFSYFTQEYIPGPSLKSLAGQLSADALQRCFKQTADLVDYLHDLGWINLDLKPAHLILKGGYWHLIDLDQARGDRPLQNQAALFGTLPYLAPEALLGEPTGKKGDYYSLGATFYEAITGNPPPLHGKTRLEVQQKQPLSPVPSIHTQDFPYRSPVAFYLTGLLQRKAELRPDSLDEISSILGLEAELPSQKHTQPADIWVGLDTPLNHLEQRYAEAEAQGGMAIVLEGPHRSGRSTLLKALADALTQILRPVLHISASDLPTQAGAALDMLQSYLKRLLDQTIDPIAAEDFKQNSVSAFESALRGRAQDILELARAAHRQFEGPLPVLIDDLHHLDHISLRVLAQIGAYLEEDGGLFLVVSTGGPAIAEVEAHLKPFCPHALRPLSREEMRRMTDQQLGVAALTSSEKIAILHRATQGWAGHIRSAIVAQWQNPKQPLEDWSPEFTAEATQRIRQSLNPTSLHLLLTASLMETPTPKRVLLAIAQLPENTPELQYLVGRGLLIESLHQEDGQRRYDFQDQGLRQSLYASIPETERQHLHRVAADQLEAESLNHHSPISPETLGYHYLNGGRAALARAYLRQGVENAFRHHRQGDACRLLGILRELEPDNAHYALRMGKTLFEVGNYQACIRTLNDLLTDPNIAAAQRAEARLYLAKSLAHTQKLSEARALLDLETIGPGQSTSRQIMGGILNAWLLIQGKDYEAATAQVEQLEALVGASEANDEIDIIHLRGLLHLSTQNLSDALKVKLESAAERSASLGYTVGELKILNILARLYLSTDQSHQAVAIGRKLVEMARNSFDLSREATANHNLALLLRSAGDPSAALDCLTRASNLYSRLRNQYRALSNKLDASEILLQNGRVDRAASLIKYVESRIAQADGKLDRLLPILKQAKTHLSAAQGNAKSLETQITPTLNRLIRNGDIQGAFKLCKKTVNQTMKQGHSQTAIKVLQQLEQKLPPSTPPALRSELHQLFANLHITRAQHLSDGARTPTLFKLPHGRHSARDLDWLDLIVTLLEAERDEASLAETVAQLVGQIFDGRALVFLFLEDGHDLVSGSTDNTSAAAAVSRSLLTQVRETREPVISMDVELNPALTSLRSLMAGDVGSVICWPVLRGNHCLGALYVDHPRAGMVDIGHARRVMDRVSQISAEMLDVLSHRRAESEVNLPDLGLPGPGKAWRQIHRQVHRFIHTKTDRLIILLQGETGTGKSRLARKIHELGRRNGPFIRVDCPAILPELFASEMFGVGKGAATGIDESRDGFFAEAAGGTLMLDEIAELDEKHQKQLLTVLQEWEYNRPGDHVTVKVDCDVILASNRDLAEAVAQGKFREDLYFRIASNRCHLPPLRDAGRTGLDRLISRFIEETTEAEDPRAPTPELFFSRSALAYLYTYQWPGNIRELENLFKNEAIAELIRHNGGRRVERKDLEDNMTLRRQVDLFLPPAGLKLKEVEELYQEAKKAYIKRELSLQNGNKVHTAKQLGVHRSTLYNILSD